MFDQDPKVATSKAKSSVKRLVDAHARLIGFISSERIRFKIHEFIISENQSSGVWPGFRFIPRYENPPGLVLYPVGKKEARSLDSSTSEAGV
jgi:hypothetical protein